MNNKYFNVGLWRYSKDYFKAASKLRENEEELSSIPVYYLYAHSIELALKAFLVTHGYSEKDISDSKIGHKLQKLWVVTKGLNIESCLENVQEIDETIDLINPYYQGKELEYIKTGFKTFPKIIHMHRSAEEVVNGVGKVVKSFLKA